MLPSVVLVPFNHFLFSENWVKARLRPHAGKTIQVCIPPFLSTALTVQESGELSASVNSNGIDTIVTFTLGLLLRLFVHDENIYDEISISGDTAFAKELIYVSQNLHCDVEQGLSRITGDILAHRIVQTSKDIKHWQKKTILNLSDALTEYWLEEQPLLAKSPYIKKFIDEVNTLKDDVEQLEVRIEKINRRDP